MTFERTVTVAASPEDVWTVLWDVERVARCLPGVEGVREIAAHERYEAVVAERVGPFRVRFALAIQIEEMDRPRRIRAVASGKDSAIGSSMKARLDVTVEPADEGSTLQVRAEIDILGKLGALGHGIIRRRGEEILAQFADALRAEVGGEHRAPTV